MTRKIGDIWTDKRGEIKTKTKDGIRNLYKAMVEEYLYPSKIPPDHTIHHIDFNHENNVLSNFALIPTALHIYIHRCQFTKMVSNLDLFKDA